MNPMPSEHPDRMAALEAVMFIHGEPIAKKKLAQILGLSPEDTEAVLSEFEATLAEAGRGLALIKDHEKVQLVTKPQFHHILASFVKEELREDLTPAALETLAIIAYFGPIARSRIDYQRGVNSMFILRTLLLRGLIERFPDPAHSNSFLYQASFDLWKHLGITKKEELPEFGKFQELLTQFESTSQ